ncbi:ribulose-phosphate 3-epimerase [Scrofimicrobium sp. R131]|uniref:Ribulose-phosphate 3-epimerase n=1 Tax=Scrofimicrobium appendicitidis TaxID=3079930 RepID=A0AAU7V3Z4_9ACTO
MQIRISPSVLNCDMGRFREELQSIDNADRVHVDVMDNHFVPNLSWGLPIVEAAKQSTEVPIEAHLMIENPDRWARSFADAGCEMVTFHSEAAGAPIRLARELRGAGAKVGLAFKPASAIEPYLDFLDEFDMFLIMTVEPGFGGQKFLPQVLSKTRKLRQLVDQSGIELDIQVDGGINRETVVTAAEAGVNNFVAGSSVFTCADHRGEVDILRRLAQEHS